MSDTIRQFSQAGNAAFLAYLTALREDRQLTPPWELLFDSSATLPCGFSGTVDRQPSGAPFQDRYEFGSYLKASLAAADRTAISFNHGLWNWLTLYFFDQLCPADGSGRRTMREIAAYFLPETVKHTRYYRHLVRSPWLAVTLHGEMSRVLLIPVTKTATPLVTTGEIFEQVASRQGVFRSPAVVAGVFKLYFNSASGRPHSGTGGGAGGSPRRLGKVLKQFELTFDLEWNDGNLVSEILPKEFNRWK